MSNTVQKQIWFSLLGAGAIIGFISALVRFVLDFFHFTQFLVYGGQFELSFISPSYRLIIELMIWMLLSVIVISLLHILNAGSDSVWIGSINGVLLQSIWSLLIMPLFGWSVWPNLLEWRTIVVEICFAMTWGTWLSMTQSYLVNLYQE